MLVRSYSAMSIYILVSFFWRNRPFITPINSLKRFLIYNFSVHDRFIILMHDYILNAWRRFSGVVLTAFPLLHNRSFENYFSCFKTEMHYSYSLTSVYWTYLGLDVWWKLSFSFAVSINACHLLLRYINEHTCVIVSLPTIRSDLALNTLSYPHL